MRTTIQTEIIINAPLEIVWNTLMQFEHYPNWNPFIHQIIGDVKVGNKIKVTLQDPQKNKMSFHAVVLNKQENQEFKWRGKLLITGLFDGEHYFQLSTIGENRTRLIHSEEFQGILVRAFLKTLETKTKTNFERMNQALKHEAEQLFSLS